LKAIGDGAMERYMKGDRVEIPSKFWQWQGEAKPKPLSQEIGGKRVGKRLFIEQISLAPSIVSQASIELHCGCGYGATQR